MSTSKTNGNKRQREAVEVVDLEEVDQRQAKRTAVEFHYGETVKLVVVHKTVETTFNVHRDLVCEHSQLVIKQLESKGHVETLKDFKPESVEMYIHYLYHNDLDLRNQAKEVARKHSGTMNKNKILCQLIRAWNVGEKFDDKQYQNAVMDTILRLNASTTADFTFARGLWVPLNVPKKTSGLNRWLTDSLVCLSTPSWLRKFQGNAPFFDEVLGRIMADARSDVPSQLPSIERREKYHVKDGDDTEAD